MIKIGKSYVKELLSITIEYDGHISPYPGCSYVQFDVIVNGNITVASFDTEEEAQEFIEENII